MFDVTRHGVAKWYQHEFEHLGWMVLAKRESIENENAEVREHMAMKVKMYAGSLKNLHTALQEKIEKVIEIDEKADLAIMAKNVESLKQFVAGSLMNSTQTGGAKRRSSKTSRKASRKASR